MSITRRVFVGAGTVGLSGLALGTCRSEQGPSASIESPPPSSDLKVSPLLYTVNEGPDRRLLTAFEGLCAFVSSPARDAMDVALLSTEPVAQALQTPMSTHFPTLVVPRAAVKGGTAIPVAADVTHAYYSIDGMDVTLEPEGGSTSKLKVNREPLKEECKPWNNFDWVLNFTDELYPSGVLARDWRKRSHIRALVKLRTGTVEAVNLSKYDKGGSGKVRFWKLKDDKERALKEIVRHTMVASSYKIKLAPRDGARPKELLLKAAGTIDIGVIQLPVPLMGDSTKLHDLWANYFLLEGGDRLLTPQSQPPLPILVDNKFCNPNATSECGCCPGTRFIDENWS